MYSIEESNCDIVGIFRRPPQSLAAVDPTANLPIGRRTGGHLTTELLPSAHSVSQKLQSRAQGEQ